MITLTGNSLNTRHYELNKKVNDDAKNKIDFKQIEHVKEQSDVDKLYKIDLASKYRNIDYILEVLKSGDSLYISRALKCDWIADDEYAHIMNPDNLHNNIFPHMPLKMKKKLVAKLLSCIRNSDRAEKFHHYCMRNRMINFGMNFLLFTTESFKMEILELHPHVYNDFSREKDYLKHFIGNSFTLAERYLKIVHKSSQIGILYDLRSLYSVSQDKYLDLLESIGYEEFHKFPQSSKRFSREIMKKHKKRVLKHPILYLKMLEDRVVAKYSSSTDAKVYAVAFLPAHQSSFWSYYYKENKYIIELIPLGERYSFIKRTFNDKYPGAEFEDCHYFYSHNYYELMTPKEQEDWALRQIASGREIHGFGNDYIWYKFTNFKTAFVELKKIILVSHDNDKRNDILKIMIDTARSQEEVSKLLDYYYNRHINELNEYKRQFLNKLIENHNILHFSENCWDALEKILHSLEVFYNLSQDRDDYLNGTYRVLAFIYIVIHEKPVPGVFNDFILNKYIITSYELKMHLLIDGDVYQKKRDLVFHYMLRTYTEHVEALMKVKANKIHDVQNYITLILDLIVDFNKTRDDIPVTINKLIMANFEMFKSHNIFRDLLELDKPVHEFNMKDIVSFLKKDAALVINEFPNIKKRLQDRGSRSRGCLYYLNWLCQKLQIYFSHDFAQTYNKFLQDCLATKELYLSLARIVVYGIFNLSNEMFITDFLINYAPVDAKIDHVKISRKHLAIQTAICSMACKARPPLPPANILEYIKGDYLKFCLPLFNSYMANLTPLKCVTFVELLLDKPVAIQKHGLRLAFACFSTDNLKNLVLKVWKSMKNVSIRQVIYKCLFDKINYHHDNPIAQWELFEALTIITHDLHENDDEEIFNLLTERLPPNIFGQHLCSGYNVVNTFPKKPKHSHLIARIVRTISSNLDLMSDNFLVAVMEEHISIVLEQHLNSDHQDLIHAKWSLIKTYLIKNVNQHILNLVMYNCLDMWPVRYNGKYIYRQFWTEFISDLENLSFGEPAKRYQDINEMFIRIKDNMAQVPLKETYILIWKLRSNILTRQVLGVNETNIFNVDIMESNIEKVQITETISNFSKEIGNMFKEFIDNELYVSSLDSDILNVISGNVSKFVRLIGPHRRYDCDDIKVLLCNVLLQYELVELNKFVMKFIPSHYKGAYTTEYIDVMNKLKSIDDTDVEYYICHKFCSDYEYRDFMP